MKILMVGGGSGGHVTPVVAVIKEIKSNYPKALISFWCDRKFFNQAQSILQGYSSDIKMRKIHAGKLRRYHHLSFVQHILWPSLVIANLRDLFLVFLGFLESLFMLIFSRPDVVFAKGGYVCLPVGIAAKILRIPLVIHDSDAHPGLTNRILSRWANKIATGAPLEFYPYQRSKTAYVGIPISPDFHEYSSKEMKLAKQKWGIRTDKPLVVVTGGGLGASRINDAVMSSLDSILEYCSVVLISGNAQFDELKKNAPENNDNFKLIPFVSKDMSLLLGAADVVVARSGATTILELAALKKPTILIPNAKLTGGHQVKNTKVYLEKNAVISLDENDLSDNPNNLLDAILDLISNPKKASELAENLNSFAKTNAAKEVAEMIVGCVN